MSAAKTRCPKCNSEMVQGFIVDFHAGGQRLVSNWVEGAPEKSFWLPARCHARDALHRMLAHRPRDPSAGAGKTERAGVAEKSVSDSCPSGSGRGKSSPPYGDREIE
jgi:hypothetical protein